MQETLDTHTHLVEVKRKTRAHTKNLVAASHVCAFKEEVLSALCFLTGVLEDSGPSDVIQDFAYQVLEKCASPGLDAIYLKWLLSDGQQHTTSRFKRPKGPRRLKPDVKERSRKDWTTGKAYKLMKLVGCTSKENIGSILKVIAEKSGLLILDHDELLLSVAQHVAVSDHVGTDTNSIYQLKQAIEALLPVLKGLLLLPNIELLDL